jgi:hypothetical protein
VASHGVERTVGNQLLKGVGLAITMVVGSGVLVLPGLAYKLVGAAAL